MPIGAASTTERHNAGAQGGMGGSVGSQGYGGGPGGSPGTDILRGIWRPPIPPNMGQGQLGDIRNAIAGTQATGGGAAAPATAATPANLTEQQAMDQILKALHGYANDYGLKALQAGGITKQGGKAIPAQWQPAFEAAFNQIYGKQALANMITDSMAEGGVTPEELAQAQTQAEALLPKTFGSDALGAEGKRLQGTYEQGLNKFNFNKMISDAFSPTSNDALIEQIVNEQLGLAQNVLNNQQARGVFTPTGWNAAQQGLATQQEAATAKVREAAQKAREAAMGNLNTYVGQQYTNAAGTPLGQTFDVAGAGQNVQNQINTAVAGLGNTIRDASTDLFDPSIITHNAGITQGMTGTGSLLDTLAQRNTGRPSSTNRGLGSQGAF